MLVQVPGPRGKILHSTLSDLSSGTEVIQKQHKRPIQVGEHHKQKRKGQEHTPLDDGHRTGQTCKNCHLEKGNEVPGL